MITLRKVAVVLIAAFVIFTCGACENPFDPLDKSSAIRGLSFIDFSVTWERWDSDPQYDGVLVAVEYFNEFGDSLDFHDKPHDVIIEFYTQQIVGGEKDDSGNVTGGRTTFAQLFFSDGVRHEHSDNDIRIPIEAYRNQLSGAGFNLKEEAQAFVIVRVRPPNSDPLPELVVGYPDQIVFRPEESEVTPNP